MTCNAPERTEGLGREHRVRNGPFGRGHMLAAEARSGPEFNARSVVSERDSRWTRRQTEALDMDDTDSLMPQAAAWGAAGAAARCHGDEVTAEDCFRRAAHHQTFRRRSHQTNGRGLEDGVADGTRTRNNQNHNLGIYH